MHRSFTLPSGHWARVQNNVMENKAGRMEEEERHWVETVTGISWMVRTSCNNRVTIASSWRKAPESGCRGCQTVVLLLSNYVTLGKQISSCLSFLTRIIKSIIFHGFAVLIKWVNAYEFLEERLACGKHSVYVSCCCCLKCEFLECQSLTFKYI